MPSREQHVTLDARYLKRPGVGISVYLGGLIEALKAIPGVRLSLLTDSEEHALRLRESHRVDATALRCASGFAWEQWHLPRHLGRSRPAAHIAGANNGLPLVSPRHTRKVLVVHDLIPLRMPLRYMPRQPAWALKYLLSTAISLLRADAVAAVSEASAGDVRKFVRRRPVHVRYPVGTGDRGSAGAPLPPEWPRTYLLYNGGLDPRKNVHNLLLAYARYRRDGGAHALVLMGTGYEQVEDEIVRLGIREHVLLPGFVTNEVKTTAIEHAAALLYPSSWEGFGLPLLEAFAAGTPVLSGTGGSLREVGGDAPVYVNVRDPGAIAAGIHRAADPGRRAGHVEAGRRRLLSLRRQAAADPLRALLAAEPL